jgi:CMP-N,N'-diacetyllegionaminic acid synthase
MKILVLILARSGSKRLKNKNIIKLKKKPLIAWTIKFAKKLPYITDIMISTDDNKIAKIGKMNKAFVPWLRPKKLSGDKITSAKTAMHAVNWYEKKVKKIDGILLLQVTSPFRNLSIFKKIIKLYKKNINKNYISVSKTNQSRSKRLYKPNGSLYLISPKKFRKYKTFITRDSIGVLFKTKKEQIDIDYKSDLNFARRILNR